MDRLRLALTLITVAIAVGPLAAVVCIHGDNLVGLAIPPEVERLMSGDVKASAFSAPVPVGQPTYDSQTRQCSFSFSFTNPLQNEIEVESLSATVVCKDHKVVLGDVSIDGPLTIQPGQTVVICASGTWTQQAIDHFKAFHCGSEDDDINVSFHDLNVEMAKIHVHLDELPDAGWVPLPR
jgi:hypothetical protein